MTIFTINSVKKPLIGFLFLIVTTKLIKLINVRVSSSKMTNVTEHLQSSSSKISPEQEHPHNAGRRCSFGVISDVQYADIPDGTNYAGTRRRYYRGALDHLKKAVTEWTAAKVDFALDLGDTIDGFGSRHNQSERILNEVLDEYDKLLKPVFFQWGNHDYYNFKKAELLANTRFNSITRNQLSVTGVNPQSMYYDFSPCAGFRVVALDLYEISMLGLPKTDPNYIRAKKLLMSINPNEDPNSSLNMPKESLRFVKFNGGASEEQIEWLDHLLGKADEEKECVLVSGHLPVYESASDAHCLAWNYESILKVLQSHSSVVAYFCGHDHAGGHAVDSAGIHHLTFPGVVETKAYEEAFAVVSVTPTELHIKGYGRVKSQRIPFKRDFHTETKHM